jgi:hypothetical protein
MAASPYRGSLLDLPGFADELAALDPDLAETKRTDARPSDEEAALRRLDENLALDSDAEAPTSDPRFVRPDASASAAPVSLPLIGFIVLMTLVGASLALVFHSQVSLILR